MPSTLAFTCILDMNLNPKLVVEEEIGLHRKLKYMQKPLWDPTMRLHISQAIDP